MKTSNIRFIQAQGVYNTVPSPEDMRDLVKDVSAVIAASDSAVVFEAYATTTDIAESIQAGSRIGYILENFHKVDAFNLGTLLPITDIGGVKVARYVFFPRTWTEKLRHRLTTKSARDKKLQQFLKKCKETIDNMDIDTLSLPYVTKTTE